jgi:hypothetical protein
VHPTTPPPQSSSSASAPEVILATEPSRLLTVWWLALHALLAAAAWLAGIAVPFKILATAAIVSHALLRRPSASPALLIVSGDGFCVVPEWDASRWPLGARSLVCPFWIRLELRLGPKRRDILLLADQVPPETWRQLRSLLMRMRCD